MINVENVRPIAVTPRQAEMVRVLHERLKALTDYAAAGAGIEGAQFVSVQGANLVFVLPSKPDTPNADPAQSRIAVPSQ